MMAIIRGDTYTITGSPSLSGGAITSTLASSSLKQDSEPSKNGLGISYSSSISTSSHASPRSQNSMTTAEIQVSSLPPTPPRRANERGSDVDLTEKASSGSISRSMLVTPVHQYSPPTPDLTPPRPLYSLDHSRLDSQRSVNSTRAESFRTAHENLTSETGSMLSLPQHNTVETGYESFLPGVTSIRHNEQTRSWLSPQRAQTKPEIRASDPNLSQDIGDQPFDDSPTLPQGLFRSLASPCQPTRLRPMFDTRLHNDHSLKHQRRTFSGPVKLPRNHDNVYCRSQDTSSLKFASILGWDDGTNNESTEGRKDSVAFATSSAEAFVIGNSRLEKSRGTLRHVSKRDSLRSASLPLSTAEHGTSREISEALHRLHHKTARLSNADRNSFSSETLPSLLLDTCSTRPKLEVIRVAVIPERVSSLSLSENQSRRSRTNSVTSVNDSVIRATSSLSSRDRRRISDSSNKDKTRYYPPQAPPFVPVRRSSTSAPTSHSASYAGSVTSETLGLERRKAEKDLRSTLERMESERLIGDQKVSLNTSQSSETKGMVVLRTSEAEANRRLSAEYHRMTTIPHGISRSHGAVAAEHNLASSSVCDAQLAEHTVRIVNVHHVAPGTREWAALRPTSTLETPFSQPSFMSSSPEINEAQAINLFSHNNHSVQLIDPYELQGSWPVPHDRSGNFEIAHNIPERYVESPLRNPRPPPQPPQVWSETSQLKHMDRQLNGNAITSSDVDGRERHRKPLLIDRARTDSLGRSLIKAITLRNPRNRKAEQNLDSEQNPFWSPRAFWDDTEQPSVVDHDGSREIVQNSLGLPVLKLQPSRVGLMHRISERRRRKVTIAKQTSYTSLRMIRSGNRFYASPLFGLNLRIININDVRNRFSNSRQRRRTERWEKRHAELRQSIGLPLLSTIDSRFPAEVSELERPTL